MDERTRVWREIGLRFVLRIPRVASEPVEKIAGDAASAPPQPSAPNSTVPDFDYPEPLMFYRRRLQPPIAAIITYTHLDHDFRGRPNDARMRLIHAIIDKAMPWSLEDVAFWPSAVYAPIPVPGEVMQASFFRVINEVNPKYIFDFGGCVDALFAGRSQSGLHDASNSSRARHVVLPSLDDMLPDNKLIKKAAWDIIRGLTP